MTDTAIMALAWCGLSTVVPTHAPRPQDRRSPLSRGGGLLSWSAVSPESRTPAAACATLDALTQIGAVRRGRPADHPGTRHYMPSLLMEYVHLLRARPSDPDTLTTVRSAHLLSAAIPTRLGTVSGLLKLLLDQIGPAGLTGTVAAAVILETGRGPRSSTCSALTSLLNQTGALTRPHR